MTVYGVTREASRLVLAVATIAQGGTNDGGCNSYDGHTDVGDLSPSTDNESDTFSSEGKERVREVTGLMTGLSSTTVNKK